MTGWWFVLPFTLLLVLVLVAPIAYTIYLSLFRSSAFFGGNEFVWFANFGQALTDPKLWDGVIRVGLFMAVQAPIMIILALAAALALDSGRLKWAPLFRIGIFLPYAIPGVVAVMIWTYMYGSQFGLVRDLSNLVGFALPNPLSNELIVPALANIQMWSFLGYNMLIFFSALQAIPRDLYEAASIDGAGQWRMIFSVKLPQIRGAITVATVFTVIGTSQLFTEPAILRSVVPGVISSFFTPNMYAYSLGFTANQANYSATVAILAGLATIVIAGIVQRVGNGKKEAR